MATALDTEELESKVKEMYRLVAEQPDNPYRFISEQAINASDKYGVKSVSLVAVKQ